MSLFSGRSSWLRADAAGAVLAFNNCMARETEAAFLNRLSVMSIENLRDEYRVQLMRTGTTAAWFRRAAERQLEIYGWERSPIGWVLAAREVAEDFLEREREEEQREREAANERDRQDALEAQADAWHDQYE